jgi:exonuclease III
MFPQMKRNSDAEVKEGKKAKVETFLTRLENQEMLSSSSFKMVSWNVAGINASLKKGFLSYVEWESADILFIQETKLNADGNYMPKALYPFQYRIYDDARYQSNCTVKKGYSGTALFSKIKPISVKYEVGDPQLDNEGRYIIAEYEGFY